jgi:hypothetical protein
MAATAAARLLVALLVVFTEMVVPLIVNCVTPALNTPLGFAVWPSEPSPSALAASAPVRLVPSTVASLETKAVVKLLDEVKRTPEAPSLTAVTPVVPVCALMAATVALRLAAASSVVLTTMLTPLIDKVVLPLANTPEGKLWA